MHSLSSFAPILTMDIISIFIFVAANGYVPELVQCGAVTRDPDLWSYLVRARRGPRGLTLLHAAAFRGDSARASILCELGAKVDAVDNGGCTPLLWSVKSCSLATARILLDSGCSLEARGSFSSVSVQRTPFYLAVSSTDVEMCRLLLSRGAGCDVAVLTEGGVPIRPLESAVFVSKNEEIAQLLMSHGADVNARDANGTTYLHRLSAVASKDVGRSIRLAQQLLDHGADINAICSGAGIIPTTPRQVASYAGSAAAGYEAFLAARGGLFVVEY